ncbi:MAG: SDR family oxidoreductase [Spirochaetes bacterium]|nr:SDR family oxidoreductase [Spirochaetota bacterium]
MKVLLTGATGYIGRRLKDILMDDPGVDLRLFVRNARRVSEAAKGRVEICEGDSLDRESLDRALQGVDVAYYLIHSMGSRGDFMELDRASALNFREACIAAGVRRIIYLGGLGAKEGASRHLLSRIETGEILSARPDRIQTIWFRAAMIIGAGSASFEILWNFVEKVPFMIVPLQIATKTEPIAVDDVLTYLMLAKDLDAEGDVVVDIGSEVMSYEDILKRTAGLLAVRRRVAKVRLPFPRLYIYIATLIFPVSRRITAALLKGVNCETVRQNDAADRYFPGIAPVPFEEAMRLAFREIENKQVLSRWSDSGGRLHDVLDHAAYPHEVLVDRTVRSFGDIPAASVFRSIMALGGEEGWFTYHFLWEIRGFIDRLFGGYGISRGRRSAGSLRIGDSLDFWRVADIMENRRLLLQAQMRLPGRAWLEFVIEGGTLVQTAYFLPHGLWGYIYWYLLKPSHYLIFSDMARNIITRAREFGKKEGGRIT